MGAEETEGARDGAATGAGRAAEEPTAALPSGSEEPTAVVPSGSEEPTVVVPSGSEEPTVVVSPEGGSEGAPPPVAARPAPPPVQVRRAPSRGASEGTEDPTLRYGWAEVAEALTKKGSARIPIVREQKAAAEPKSPAEPKSYLDRYWRDHYPENVPDDGWVVSFENVKKRFGKYTAVKDINFKIYDIPGKGEFICVLGPSGCGKSTILNMIAGFYGPSEGTVKVKGKVVQGPGADRGMVFQSYSSFPNLTVWQNVAFGLMLQQLNRPKNPISWALERLIGVRGRRRREIRDEAMRWVQLVELDGSEDKYPHELSGGMRQRVAIARTLAVKPRVLLMDEPFGALDRVTRWEMQDLLVKIWHEVEATVFLITHDLAEAVYLGDRVFIMSEAPGTILEEVPVPHPDRPAAEMQREPEFGAIVNEISAKVERRYFEEQQRRGAPAAQVAET